MKKKVLSFFGTFFQTINPLSYEELSEKNGKDAFLFFVSSVFAAFIIMFLCLIPSLITMPDQLETQFNKIDNFTFKIDFKTNAPIKFPENNPVLVISYDNETTNEKANVILDNNVLYYGILMQNNVLDLTSYKNAKEKKSEISNILGIILVIMLPMLLLIFFFYSLIKYFLMAIAATLLLSIIIGLFGKQIKFKQTYNIVFYASAISMIIDGVFFAFGFSYYGIQFLPSILLMTIAGFMNSEKRPNAKQKNKYVEIK